MKKKCVVRYYVEARHEQTQTNKQTNKQERMHCKIFCGSASHNLNIPACGRCFLGHQCNQASPPLIISICRPAFTRYQDAKQSDLIAGVLVMCHGRLPGSSTPSAPAPAPTARSPARTLSRTATTTTIGANLQLFHCSGHLRFPSSSGQSLAVNPSTSLEPLHLCQLRLHRVPHRA